MSEPKTRPTKASVDKFIEAQSSETVRDDCRTLISLMEKVSGEPPVMWGTSIIGFGSYRYVYASGKEGDWPILAFSPRKQNLTVYLMGGLTGKEALLKKLGKHKAKGVCLHFKTLEGLHQPTLKKLVIDSHKHVLKLHGKN